MKKYTFKFFVKAIVQTTISANNLEEATTKAKEIVNKNFFAPKVEIVDESSKIIGYDDDDAWEEMSN